MNLNLEKEGKNMKQPLIKNYDELRDAFQRYISGETEATHNVAYMRQKLIEDVELIVE